MHYRSFQRWGDNLKVTMRDVARYANVSLSTVSRVISKKGYVSEETKKLVMKTCKELNYTPAFMQNDMRIHTNVVGVLTADLKNEFNVHIIEGITGVADQKGFEILIYDAQEKQDREKRAMQLFSKVPLKAVIITPVMDTGNINFELIKSIESLKIPVVLVDRDIPYANFDAVLLDNVTGAFDGVHALIENGHRKIATIAGTEASLTGKDRIIGYKKAMFTHNLPIIDGYIQDGKFTAEGGYQAMKKLLEHPQPPTAVFVANVVMMRGCYKAIRERKIEIPRDIAIVSFDDLCGNEDAKNLSTIAQPMGEMGKMAMDILLERLNAPVHQKETKHVILPSKLILRGSEKYIN